MMRLPRCRVLSWRVVAWWVESLWFTPRQLVSRVLGGVVLSSVLVAGILPMPIAGAGGGGLGTTAVQAKNKGTKLENKKSSVDERVAELTKQFEGLDEKLARMIAEKEAAEERLPEAKEQLAQAQVAAEKAQRRHDKLAAKLTTARNTQKKLQHRVADAQQKIENTHDEVEKIARQAYQYSGITSDVAMMLQFAQAKPGTEGLVRVDAAVQAQQKAMAKLAQQREANRRAENRLAAVAKEIADLKSQAAQALEETRAAEAAAQETKSELDTLIETKDTAAEKIEANRARISAELERQRQEQERLAEEIIAWERKAAEEGTTIASGGELASPAPSAQITSPFGYRIHPITGTRRLHTGTDFGLACGSPVHAAGDGIVVSAGWAGGYGKRVVISHGTIDGHRIASTYNHNTHLSVSAGDHVKRGQVIARSGTTGASTGCHLHFEVMRDGQYVDPKPYITR